MVITVFSTLCILSLFILTQCAVKRCGAEQFSVDDTLQYRMNSIEMISDDSLLFMKLSYPIIEDNNEKLAKMLNSSYEAILYTLLFQDYCTNALLEDQLHNRFAELERDRQNTHRSILWNLLQNVTIVNNRYGILSTCFAVEQYTGGAHGSRSLLYISSRYNGDIQEIALGQFFSPENMKKVTALGESCFREIRSISDTADLGQEGFWFPDDKFSLTENFAVLPEGLTFHYNNYTIGPYALGETTIHIPYESFAPFLKPGASSYWGK